MARRTPQVEMGFERKGIRLLIDSIRPLHPVPDSIKGTQKYKQIAASIKDVGIVEPPIVARDKSNAGYYILLDGHLRLTVLSELGETEVTCLISHDDEAYTYNKRINRLAIVQEHKMILKAVDRGVSEERIARALNVNVANIRLKRRLLQGICPEAVELLKDKHIGIHAFGLMRKVVPLRQIEIAEVMVAMNKYTISYIKSLVAATPRAQMIEPRKKFKGLTDEQLSLMERESESLDREFKLAEQSYGTDYLDLVLIKGYLSKLLRNARVTKYLSQRHEGMLGEFQAIAELGKAPPSVA